MGGLEGQRTGRAGAGAQYTLFKLVYILEENCAFCQIRCRFAQDFDGNWILPQREVTTNFHELTRRGFGFMGLAVASLFYPNSQAYSKPACAFGLRSSSKLPTSRRGEAKETPFFVRGGFTVIKADLDRFFL